MTTKQSVEAIEVIRERSPLTRMIFWLKLKTSITYSLFFFFFNDTATTEISPLPLHAALPICRLGGGVVVERHPVFAAQRLGGDEPAVTRRRVGPEPAIRCTVAVQVRAGMTRVVDGDREEDRKSTRLNSSHSQSRMPASALKKKKREHLGGEAGELGVPRPSVRPIGDLSPGGRHPLGPGPGRAGRAALLLRLPPTARGVRQV